MEHNTSDGMIAGPYTLFTHIPVSLGPDGQVMATSLWAKDLELHLDYIDQFRLCCPVLPAQSPPSDARAVVGLQADQVIGLRPDQGWIGVLRNLVPNFRRVARAVRGARVVHAGGAGWPFPLAFYLLPLRWLRRFSWVMVIESSFWMKPGDRRASLPEWLSHHLHTILLRACLRRADARIFTQDGYRQYFACETERSLIAPAVWVDAAQILSESAQQTRRAALPDDEIRLLFPARMVPDKGLGTVLEAITLLDSRMSAGQGPKIVVDFIGAGPLVETCRRFIADHQGQVAVRYLDPVDYGAPFLSLLQGYHAILLANLQHEQPRVIFDAFSQGVPVISSATTGVCDVVQDGQDVLLYGIGSGAELADRMLQFAGDPALQAQLMSGALATAQGHSHVAMHEKRHVFLQQVLPG